MVKTFYEAVEVLKPITRVAERSQQHGLFAGCFSAIKLARLVDATVVE